MLQHGGFFSFYIGNKTYQNKKSSFLYLFVSTFALTPLLSSSPEFPGCFLKRLRSYPYNLIRIMPAKGVQFSTGLHTGSSAQILLK